MGLGDVVMGFDACRVVGVGVFCFFSAALVGLEDLLGVEADDGLGRVDVDVLRLHDGDVGLGGDLGVGGHFPHVCLNITPPH